MHYEVVEGTNLITAAAKTVGFNLEMWDGYMANKYTCVAFNVLKMSAKYKYRKDRK